jgi:hypothetical protein
MSGLSTKGFVYLLLTGDELYKIGISKDSPQGRLKSLQTGNPFQIQLLKQYISPHYKKIEKMLHRRFASLRTREKGEWFHLKEHHVFQFEEYCKKAEDAIAILLELNPFYK